METPIEFANPRVSITAAGFQLGIVSTRPRISTLGPLPERAVPYEAGFWNLNVLGVRT
jgi:hypothetical protein